MILSKTFILVLTLVSVIPFFSDINIISSHYIVVLFTIVSMMVSFKLSKKLLNLKQQVIVPKKIINEIFPESIRKNSIVFFKYIFISFIFFILCCILFTYLGSNGLTSRDLAFEKFRDLGSFQYFLIYLNISTASFFLSKILMSKRKDVKFYLSYIVLILLSSFLFSFTGTRWYFLVTISPLIVYILFFLKFKDTFIYIFVFLVFLAILSIIRSDAVINKSFYFTQITSFNAFELIYKYPLKMNILHFEQFTKFVTSNIHSVIPSRFIAFKDYDYLLEYYNLVELGIGPVSNGATKFYSILIFPFFYGGLIPYFLLIFAIIYCLMYLEHHFLFTSPASFTLSSLLFSGLIMQIRNPSIAYLIPFFLGLLIFLLVKSIKKND